VPRLLALLLLLAAACATPQQRRSWDTLASPAQRAPAPAARPALPPLEPARVTPALAPAARPPRPAAYGAPPGGRPIADFRGPLAPIPARPLALPESLWVPALAPEDARAVEAGRLAPELAVDGVAEADVDGDGRAELVVLARPADLFSAERERRYALLLVLAEAEGGHRLHAFARLRSSRHAAGGGPARWCHAEHRIAGFLHRGGRALPVVWQERGEGCAQLVGGGFDRVLHLIDPVEGSAREIAVARARLGEAGAVDLYDGAAWAADVDGDGAEELVVRGIASAARPCGRAEGASWIEELAARAVDPAGVRAVRDGRALELSGGALPPSLLRTHAAACGPPPDLR